MITCISINKGIRVVYHSPGAGKVSPKLARKDRKLEGTLIQILKEPYKYPRVENLWSETEPQPLPPKTNIQNPCIFCA